MDTTPGKLQRKYPRRPCQLNIGVLYLGKYVVTQAIEIGEGGLLVKTKSEYGVGSKLLITLFLTDAIPFLIIASIKYSKASENNSHWSTGIAFDTLELAEKRKIRSFIVTLAPSASEKT